MAVLFVLSHGIPLGEQIIDGILAQNTAFEVMGEFSSPVGIQILQPQRTAIIIG